MAEEVKTVEEELIVDEAAVKAIAKEVTKGLEPEVAEAAQKAAEEASKSVLDKYVAKTEEVAAKAVKEADQARTEKELAADPIAKGIADGVIDAEVAKMSPSMRFYRQMKALIDEDSTELKRINQYTLAAQKKARAAVEAEGEAALAKTGYANSTTAADGSVLIPDPEFVTTVFDNLPKYGVAFTYADVRQTDRTSVRVISLDSGLTFYATNEAGVKTSAKLSFSKNEVSLQKYAVIVPAADEFTDDAAVDYWNLVTKELSRAYAKKADEVTFTDSSSGITNQTGVLTHTLGAGLNWDDLLVAQSKTEDDLDESGAKWYMRKETWYSLIQTKGTTNDHYIAGSLNTATGWVANPNQPTTPWGTPVVFTRVLPTINSVSANDAVAVYGDLSNYLLYNKRGMALKILTEATVVDSEGTDLHLGSQDASAMRAVVRMLGILPKGNRGKFVVLGTGTVS
jgi:HK97 family phage major capsid protein